MKPLKIFLVIIFAVYIIPTILSQITGNKYDLAADKKTPVQFARDTSIPIHHDTIDKKELVNIEWHDFSKLKFYFGGDKYIKIDSTGHIFLINCDSITAIKQLIKFYLEQWRYKDSILFLYRQTYEYKYSDYNIQTRQYGINPMCF